VPATFAADPDIERGLAISDFWMAVNFMSSALMNLAGNNIGSKEEKHFCSFNGFMIQVFVVQSMRQTSLLLSPFLLFHSRLLDSYNCRMHIFDTSRSQAPVIMDSGPQNNNLDTSMASIHFLGGYRLGGCGIRGHRCL